MRWMALLKVDLFEEVKRQGQQYWAYAHQMPGNGEVATLEAKVLAYIKAQKGKPAEDVIAGALRVAELYVMGD